MLKNVLSSVAVVSCLPAVIAAQEPIALDIHILLREDLSALRL